MNNKPRSRPLSKALEAPTPIDYEKLCDKHIFFATPCYGGQITESYFQSFCRLISTLNRRDLRFTVATLGNESLISRARNTLVAYFLAQAEATHLMFIDADMGFDTESVLRMLNYDEDVVVGAGPKKEIDWSRVARAARHGVPPAELPDHAGNFVANFKFVDPFTKEIEMKDWLIEIEEGGTAFMLIKRQVFESMIQHYPELHYDADFNIGPEHRSYLYSFFDCMHDPQTNRYLSEDYTFCRRWQQIGGKVWLDPRVNLTHTGSYVYRGDFQQMFSFSPRDDSRTGSAF